MYQPRTIIRVPVHRMAKPSPALARSASMCGGPALSFPFSSRLSPQSSLFAPLASDRDFAPLFRLLDDFAPLPQQIQQLQRSTRPSFNPRFDVREVDKVYELRGELPGVESKDLEITFTDAETLVIRGSTSHETSNGMPPTADVASVQPAAESAQSELASDVDNSDNQSTTSASSYVKPSVEDEDEDTTSMNGAGIATPNSSKDLDAQVEAAQQSPAEPKGKERETFNNESQNSSQVQTQQEQPQSRYWISECSTGTFQRTFSFAGRINQDGVTASLRNGILSMVIPKAEPLSVKRISVQ